MKIDVSVLNGAAWRWHWQEEESSIISGFLSQFICALLSAWFGWFFLQPALWIIEELRAGLAYAVCSLLRSYCTDVRDVKVYYFPGKKKSRDWHDTQSEIIFSAVCLHWFPLARTQFASILTATLSGRPSYIIAYFPLFDRDSQSWSELHRRGTSFKNMSIYCFRAHWLK